MTEERIQQIISETILNGCFADALAEEGWEGDCDRSEGDHITEEYCVKAEELLAKAFYRVQKV